MEAIVTSKGQVTIPIAIRAMAQISPGTKLDFQVEPDGTLKVSLVNQDMRQLKGMVKSHRKKPVSIKEMKKAVREGAKKATR